jgi:hypothetical protein
MSPETFSAAAEEAVRRKARDGERSMTTVTEAGVPVPRSNPLYASRFADSNPTVREILAEQITNVGGLASIADDKKNKMAQKFLRETAGRIFDSPMNDFGGMA